MDARIRHIAFGLACCTLLGASYRTQNFIVEASTPALAQEVGDAAEQYRHDLAIEWLGEELPPWRDICPIHVTVGQHLGAGGATSFSFMPPFVKRGRAMGWTMSIQGSHERILDSVLPHEITHTVFATHFGRPLPRWADEGACTTVEHVSERQKQEEWLVDMLQTQRGIPFNRMFAMKDYPRDILPLYAQGFSLARYLIAQGGKRKFVEYIGDGMNSNNWTMATKRLYGFESLSDLQVRWNQWVARGSPKLGVASATLTSSATRQKAREPEFLGTSKRPKPLSLVADVRGSDLQFSRIRQVPAADQEKAKNWYAQQRDRLVSQENRQPRSRLFGDVSFRQLPKD